jgi:hypothetical protein
LVLKMIILTIISGCCFRLFMSLRVKWKQNLSYSSLKGFSYNLVPFILHFYFFILEFLPSPYFITPPPLLPAMYCIYPQLTVGFLFNFYIFLHWNSAIVLYPSPRGR